MKIINKEHPVWQNAWASHQQLSLKELPLEMQDMVQLEADSYPEHGYDQVPIHFFGNDQLGMYLVYEYENGFVTYVMGMMDYDMKLFASLEEAFEATFINYFPETGRGDWNDADDYVVDGVWLIKDYE